LHTLRAFEASARTLSFTKAAEELCVTASAVSQQIRQLEDQLEVKLFKRLVWGLALTDEGRVLLPHVRQGFEAFRKGVEAISDPQMSRKLKLLVLSSFATKWLVPRLGNFARAHANIEISLFHNHVPPDFRSTDFDMAILWGTGQWSGCDSYFLMNEYVFPVCVPGMLPDPLPGEAPSFGDHVVLRTAILSQWSLWQAAAGMDDAAISRNRVFDDGAMMIDAAIDGQGIGLARSVLAADALEDGRLTVPYGPILESPWSYYMVVPSDRPISETVETFMDWAAAEARASSHNRILEFAVPKVPAPEALVL
jgi:LysR family glycine cleavage system transcriptional activator